MNSKYHRVVFNWSNGAQVWHAITARSLEIAKKKAAAMARSWERNGIAPESWTVDRPTY